MCVERIVVVLWIQKSGGVEWKCEVEEILRCLARKSETDENNSLGF